MESHKFSITGTNVLEIFNKDVIQFRIFGEK